MNWRLDYADGDFILIEAPPLIGRCGDRLTLLSREIRGYHLELQKAIQGQVVWPPEDSDAVLFTRYALYYRKVAELVDSRIRIELLSPVSRHRFFICTEPIDRDGQVAVGLSGLEQLMGYSLEPSSAPPPRHTTGSGELDVLVDSMLIFKRSALPLAEIMSIEALALMNMQANNRMSTEESQSPEIENAPPETWQDDEEFLQAKDKIEAWLNSQEILYPANF